MPRATAIRNVSLPLVYTGVEKEEREDILDEFKEKYFAFYHSDFFDKTGVAFNNLPLREQGSFLSFASEKDKDLKDKLPGIFAKIQLLLDGYETTFENRMIEFLYLKIEIGELVNSLDEKLKNNGNSYCSLFCSNPQSCHPDDCYIKKFRDAAYEREKPIGTFSMETGKYGSF